MIFETNHFLYNNLKQVLKQKNCSPSLVANCNLPDSFSDNSTIPPLAQAVFSPDSSAAPIPNTDLLPENKIVVLCSVLCSVIISSWNLRRCPECTLTDCTTTEDWWGGGEVYAGSVSVNRCQSSCRQQDRPRTEEDLISLNTTVSELHLESRDLDQV